MKKFKMILSMFVLSVAASACASDEEAKDKQLNEEAAPVSAKTPYNVKIINSKGSTIGSAILSEGSKGVNIQLMAEGLEPGKKAIHIHETGKCTAPDFKSAGEHFNPLGKEHGFNNPKGFHAGDLPNIEISAQGKVEVELNATEVTLQPGQKNSLLDADGSAIVIHEGPDDYKTNPAGNAGDRIACGEIVKAQ
ncbi:MAG TPA: superoxide dismutase family protein [Bacillaceae bacterium]